MSVLNKNVVIKEYESIQEVNIKCGLLWSDTKEGELKQLLKLQVNGDLYEVMVEQHRTLLEVLRENLGLTGTKECCGLGTCGACTVLMDQKATLSCLTLAIEAQGKEITTIEGVAQRGQLHPLQQAFIDNGAIQCGFCTPGMIMSAIALLENDPSPTEAEIRRAISGNFCRCTGYVKIIDAIKEVAGKGHEDDTFAKV